MNIKSQYFYTNTADILGKNIDEVSEKTRIDLKNGAEVYYKREDTEKTVLNEMYKYRGADVKIRLEFFGNCLYSVQFCFNNDDDGLKTAAKLVSDDFMDIMDLSDKYSVADIRVPSDWIGKSIAELDVRREYEINIVAVKSGGDINVNPKSDCVFRENDVITAVGEKAVMSRLDGKR